MSEIIPIFKTAGSIGKSILTCDKNDEIDDTQPVSVCDIANFYNLDKVLIIDDSFSFFRQLYVNFKKTKSQLIFGVNFRLCNDRMDKSEASLNTESKISVIAKNSQGEKDLIKLHNAINKNPEYFYYVPRVDWTLLKLYWTENLDLLFPPYDNFIHLNLLHGHQCLPDFGQIRPIMTYADMGLPFDAVLKKAIQRYCATEKINECNEVHPIYYYGYNNFKAYMIFRCVENRSSFIQPEMDYFSSNEFCWESYCKKKGIEFKNAWK